MTAWPNGAPKPGQRAERTRRVQSRDIELFTEITGDRNPLHYDERLAAGSRFGEIIVQGGVTSGILNAVVAEELPGPGTVFLHVDWDFKAPVRPGEEITGEVEVLEARDDKPITRLRTTVTRADGVVALDGTAVCYTTPLGRPLGGTAVVTLRPMTDDDLGLVSAWLTQPHVARWWDDAEAELREYREWVRGAGDRTLTLLTVLEHDRPVGWCQWYRWDVDPAEAAAIGALPGECGIDYALGELDAIGRGLGTEMIAALVAEVRRHHPGCGILVDPEAANHASRRVLEKNGFALVEVRPVAAELHDRPMAIYRRIAF